MTASPHVPPARTTNEGLAPFEQNANSMRLLIRLLRCTQALRNRLRTRLDEEFGITLPQWDLIATIARRTDGLTMTHLSEALMVSNGNVTQVVNRLVQDGFVTKKGHRTDGRVSMVRLTRQGRLLFERVAAANSRWADEMFAQLREGEIGSLNELLASLRASIEIHGK